MKFKEFLEAADIDTSNIDIGTLHRYSFMFGGNSYTVKFYKGIREFNPNTRLPSGSIYFEGPNDYSPTGLSGYKAPKLYGIMLSIIKLFIERDDPKILNFSGSMLEMDLVYKKFAEKYIGDKPGRPSNKIFIQFNEHEWIRKDAYESLQPDIKSHVDGQMKKWDSQRDENYKLARQSGIDRRNNYIKYKSCIGSFILVDDWRWCLVLKVDRDAIITYAEFTPTLDIRDMDTRWYENRIKLFDDINQVPRSVIEQFAWKLSSPIYSTKLAAYSDIVNKIIQLGGQ